MVLVLGRVIPLWKREKPPTGGTLCPVPEYLSTSTLLQLFRRHNLRPQVPRSLSIFFAVRTVPHPILTHTPTPQHPHPLLFLLSFVPSSFFFFPSYQVVMPHAGGPCSLLPPLLSSCPMLREVRGNTLLTATHPHANIEISHAPPPS